MTPVSTCFDLPELWRLTHAITALVVVYDYHPNATTLFETHIKSRATQASNGRGNRSQQDRIPERTLWSCVVQIASAIKAVHDAGLSVRVIDVSKVLITSKNRLVVLSCYSGPILR